MNKKTSLVLAALLIVASRAVALAQEDKVVSETNLVTVNVIVTDNNGRYVKGLRQDQFEIYDEKEKRQITHFSTDEAAVSLGIVWEIHNTTSAESRAMLTSLRRFTRSLREEDDFFFSAFS